MTIGAQNAFERLQRINWAECGKGPYSPKIRGLFDHYMRIVVACHRPDAPGGAEEFFSLIHTMYAETHPLPEEVSQWLDGDFWKQYQWAGWEYAYWALYGFILWYELSPAEREKITAESWIANPYTPLVEFFEAGGAFSCENGIVKYILPAAPPDKEG